MGAGTGRLGGVGRPGLILVVLLGLGTSGAAAEGGIEREIAAGETSPRGTISDDTIPRDTIPGDTIPRDTLPPDTLPNDTLPVPEEPLPEPVDYPDMARAVPPGFATGVWKWDQATLLDSRAMSLEELLREVPGVITLRTGDYGNPAAPSAFGLDAGRIRVFLDGFELAPIEGGVPDLSQISLAGVEDVRVQRLPGELRVELRSLRVVDARPYSFVQAGTGDLNTDYFQGAFVHPRAFGGNASLALDRVGTDGPNRQEPGSVLGVAFRYSLHRDDRGGAGVEVRRSTVRRAEGVFLPRELVRTDWVARGRREIMDGIVAEAFVGRSGLSEGGEDSADTLDITTLDRGQYGVRLSGERGWLSGEAGYRRMSGGGWPTDRMELQGTFATPELGGVEVGAERESWEGGGAATTTRLRAWTRPLLGTSFFLQLSDGRHGVPFVPPVPDPDEEEEEENGNGNGGLALPGMPGFAAQITGEMPEGGSSPRFTDRTTARAGAEFAWRGVRLGGAWLLLRADSLHPLGLPTDRGGPVAPGGEVQGFEVSGRLPVPVLGGLAAEGTWHGWTQGPELRYLPREVWSAGLTYRNVFLESENLEVWADLGARGRDRMLVPGARETEAGPDQPQVVPSLLSWSFRLQIRVQTVRAFVHWDNLTFRQDNQDFPGRLLPGSRAYYGIRWTMWN